MNPGSSPCHPRLLLGALFALVVCVGTRAADWQALTGNSPFGPAAGTAPATPPDQLEFRGVVQEEGVYLVNLFNPTTKTSQWVPVKGKVPGIEVKSYDAGTDKIEITQGGRPLTLALKQAHVALVQPAAPVAPLPENADGNRGERGEARGRPGPGPGNGTAENSPMVRNLPPEAQAMINEFRRRRAERANQQPQAQQQPQQPQQESNRPNRQR
jgi:hypothetical protein